jgi:hypothetical protein
MLYVTKNRSQNRNKDIEDDQLLTWNDNNGQECRNSVTEVLPVDIDYIPDHERTRDDECTTSCPGRDTSKDGCEEDGDEEADAASHGRQTGLATFGNTLQSDMSMIGQEEEIIKYAQ